MHMYHVRDTTGGEALIRVTQSDSQWLFKNEYGVATISRLLQIIGLFRKRAL